ncbi:hypothetical protein Ciccas_005226 [Cichlidogyrus casuarinus]|uniref:Muscle-specific protein 300 n=1 Tax=Cichlidogyrus casuarinus TaxID=1844966 RepID=A0ABD2QCU3_9PLAT
MDELCNSFRHLTYQALYDDLLVRRSDLNKIKEQAEELAALGLPERLSGLASEHESLISICRDVNARLELLATEQRNFKNLVEDLSKWISSQCTRLSICADLEVPVETLRANLSTVKDISNQLDQGQAKVLQAEECADRVNTNASNVAMIAEEALRLVNQRQTFHDTKAGPFLSPRQRVVIQQHQSIGDKAKTTVHEDLEECIRKLVKFEEMHSRLENFVSRLELEEKACAQIGQSALDRYEQQELTAQAVNQFWQEYAERYRSMRREIESEQGEFEDLKMLVTKIHVPGMVPKANSLIQRFVTLRNEVQTRNDRINQFQREHDNFSEVANSYERWAIGMNFKLLNSSKQDLTESAVPPAKQETSLVEAKRSAQHHSELTKEIETQGKVYQTRILTLLESLKNSLSLGKETAHTSQILVLRYLLF